MADEPEISNCPQCGKPIETPHTQRIIRRIRRPADMKKFDMRGGTFKSMRHGDGLWTYNETLCSPLCGSHHQMSMEG